MEFRRDGLPQVTTLIPVYDKSAERPLVGITSSSDFRQPGFFEAIGLAFYKTGYIIYKMLEGLWGMITGSAKAELAGPLRDVSYIHYKYERQAEQQS